MAWVAVLPTLIEDFVTLVVFYCRLGLSVVGVGFLAVFLLFGQVAVLLICFTL